MNNFQSLILLNTIDGLGSVRLKKLIEAFKEPCKIFEVGLERLNACGIITNQLAQKILDAPRRFDVGKEIDEARQKGIKILTLFDKEYPLELKEIYDPPYVLYVKGELMPEDRNAVAIVGSRGASYYGLSCAKFFSMKLSEFGLSIVSGMARGIDTVSHRAALDAGGHTIAVLGSGLNKIYPPENEGLFSEIAEKGAVVSQFSLNTPPLAHNFPIRNRIISGLSKGVLVVEASYKSGALITARYALEQGREVFAIPGKLSSPTSSGTNELIKQGAKMVTEPQEVLEELRHNIFIPKSDDRDAAVEKNKDNLSGRLSTSEESVVNILDDEPKYIDVISQEAGLSISESMSILLQLELKGVVKQFPGKTFIKVSFATNF